jgi:DNA-binding winged helix-turn-helix (wHTH) protein
MTLRFGDCVFDPDARELTRAGRSVPLSPKAFQLLGLLLAGRPRALAQAALRDQLWPATHVARTSLARLVTEIRQATGDAARAPRYVRNVHGFGYAFCGAVTEEDAPPAAGPELVPGCALVWGERVFLLIEGENLLGRSADCRLPIDSFLGGRRLERPERLEDGATVIVGPALLVFRAGDGHDSTKTASSVL